MSKEISKSLLMTALICGNVLWGGTAVFAEENEDIDLDEMVVTATRTMKQIQEVPSSISVVTAKDIQQRNIKSLPEALQTLPGVYMSQSPSYGSAGDLTIRGFSSKEILVLIDGAVMNGAYNNEVQWEMIPVENIERIEVAKGAASSLYGGRAVGAVVNIITKNETENGAHANIVVNYGSNNTWKKAAYVDVKANDKVSFGVGYENKKSDGYKNYLYRSTASETKSDTVINGKLDKIPEQANGKYVLGGRGDKSWENENITANIKYNFDESKSVKYTFTKAESTYKYGTPWTTLYSNGKPVFSGKYDIGNGQYLAPALNYYYLGYDGKKESDTHTFSYNDEDNKFSVNFGYLNIKRNGYSEPSGANSIYWEGAGSESYYPGKTYSLDIQKAWDNIGKHTIVAGVNYRQESFEQIKNVLTRWRDHDSIDTSKYNGGISDVQGGKSKNYAIFVQDEYKISDPVTMYLGLRYDEYKKLDGKSREYKDDGSLKTSVNHEEASYSEISPKVAFGFKADDKTNYYVSYGHSFNPPPLYNVYRQTSSYLANPDLKPETSDTFEIGMKKKLSDKTQLGVSLFKVKTDDKIASVKIKDKISKYFNLNEETRKGVELELNHEFNDNWKAYFNYAWQQGESDKIATVNGSKVSQTTSLDIPRHLLHAGINYNKDNWDALLECQYVSERNTTDVVTGEYGSQDAFFIVNTAVNYKIAKDTTLQFAINNLFDKEFYCSDMTPGRTYSVGLRYSF